MDDAEVRTILLEVRALIAESKANLAELRVAVASSSVEVIELRSLMGTVIDAIADLRGDFADAQEQLHASIDEEDED